MDTGKYNVRNPAVKRILQEVREMRDCADAGFAAEPLEDNIFEWIFAIKGPQDTEFEGGVYFGRILLPADYPFKPPSFMMLTPNGRFEVNTKICLSISQHHPEHWQPSWSVRTALTALIAFMPTPGNGALGSLDFPKEERQRLACQSRAAPPAFGDAARQEIMARMHQQLLHAAAPAQSPASNACNTTASNTGADASALQDALPSPTPQTQSSLSSNPAGVSTPESTSAIPEAARTDQSKSVLRQPSRPRNVSARANQQSTALDEWQLTLITIAITIALVALLAKKALSGFGIDAYDAIMSLHSSTS